MLPPSRLATLIFVLLLITTIAPAASPIRAAQSVQAEAAGAAQARTLPLSIAAANPERPPYNMSARALSNTSIRVSWNNASYIDGFRLYRWNGSSWQLIRERFTNTWYDDKNLTSGTTYYYTVCSYYGSNTACAEGYTSAATGSAAPPGPTGLWAQALSSSSIRVGWNQPCWSQPCVTVKSFRIYRQRAGTSTAELVMTVFGDMRRWDDTGLASNTEYYYTVCADNDLGGNCAASWTRAKSY